MVKIAFLNVLIHGHEDGTLTTQVYRKPSNTNVIIGPPRPIYTHYHATRICTSPTQAKKEVEFLLNVYEDNGFYRKRFEKNRLYLQTPSNRPTEK